MLRYLLFMSFALTCLGLTAQDGYFGVRTGFHSASFSEASSGGTAPALNSLRAMNVGLVASLKSSRSLIGWSMEPGYMLKGSATNIDSVNRRLHYLSMPVFIDFYPFSRLKISAGPEVSYLGWARNKVNDSTAIDVSNVYDQRWEFSGTLGVSFAVSYFLDLGIRYNQSFTKAASIDAVLDRRDLYNRYVQLALVWKIAN